MFIHNKINNVHQTRTISNLIKLQTDIDDGSTNFSRNISEDINILTLFCTLLKIFLLLCSFSIYCFIYLKKSIFDNTFWKMFFLSYSQPISSQTSIIISPGIRQYLSKRWLVLQKRTRIVSNFLLLLQIFLLCMSVSPRSLVQVSKYA